MERNIIAILNIKKIIRDNTKNYTSEYQILEEIDKFLEQYSLPEPTQEVIEN